MKNKTAKAAAQRPFRPCISASTQAADCAPFITFMLERLQASLSDFLAKTGGVNGGVGGGVNNELNRVLDFIRTTPNLRANAIAVVLDIPPRTLERYLKTLREQGKILFVGVPKTGGYRAVGKRTQIVKKKP